MRFIWGIVLSVVMLQSVIVNAADCYQSTIMSPSPFMGNNDEIFKLDDGSIWQVKYEYEYLYEYHPTVIVCPAKGKLGIKGKMLSISSIGGLGKAGGKSKEVIETQIDGAFEGWQGQTIVKLSNGQIWQQSEYFYEYYYSYSPKVLIFSSAGGYVMQVEGVSKAVGVTMLK